MITLDRAETSRALWARWVRWAGGTRYQAGDLEIYGSHHRATRRSAPATTLMVEAGAAKAITAKCRQREPERHRRLAVQVDRALRFRGQPRVQGAVDLGQALVVPFGARIGFEERHGDACHSDGG
jgi:hypothetical protein